MGRIVTISYTGLDADGGVPKFNRDLHAAFPDRECVHYCWQDHPFYPELEAQGDLPEWHKARTLNNYLVSRGALREDDVIIADGFWADGLQSMKFAVSHSHGIWSHLTKEDVDAGKQPDMPYHHAAQVTFRKRWTDLGKRLTAVSDFIANQLKLQWGWDAAVINNGVDTELFKPMEKSNAYGLRRPLIIHGVNDRGNANKGWDHIEFIMNENPEWTVMSLDQAYESFVARSDRPWTKSEVLSQADGVVHPSGYEGNSMFVAEALSCGVPVLGYDVGFLWKVLHTDKSRAQCGWIMNLKDRSKFITEVGCHVLLGLNATNNPCGIGARATVLKELSIEKFNSGWRSYVEELTK